MIVHEHDAPQKTLVFFLGAAGTGKTFLCLKDLRARESLGREAFYLVPEQSTYLADRELLDPDAGLEAVRHVRVLSFRRLAHLLEDGRERRQRPLDPAARRMIVRNLVQGLDPSLRLGFSRVLDRPGFTEALVQALRELRYEGGPEGIAWLDSPGSSARLPEELRRKIELLSGLRRDYDRVLFERGLLDPDLFLADAPRAIGDHPEIFRDRDIYVDGYLSFTRLEAEMLLALTLSGARLTIALCCEPAIAVRAESCPPPMPPGFRLQSWPRDFLSSLDRPVFLGPARTYLELTARFRHAGIRVSARSLPLPGAPTRYGAPVLQAIAERALRSHPRGVAAPPAVPEPILPPTGAPAASGIELHVARDPAHEVEIWARAIDRWIRLDSDVELDADARTRSRQTAGPALGTAGADSAKPEARPLRSGEIAIIVRDLEPYRPYVEQIFGRFHIPFFLDRHWDLASRPLARTLLSALEILRSGWARDAVISFLRSPLAGTRPGDVDLLENLSLEAGFNFGSWHGPPWEPISRPARVRFLSRGGDDQDQEQEAEERERHIREREREWEGLRTAVANRMRATHLAPIRILELGLGAASDPREGVRHLRGWIDGCAIRERFLATDNGSPGSAEREWDAVLEVVERIGDEPATGGIAIDHLVRLLRSGLDSLQLGRTPTGCDQVTLAEVQRSRLGPIRAAIVGGLSSDQYPRSGSGTGFWNASERECLGTLGFVLGTPDSLRQEEEAYFFYIAMTRASERAMLTRPASDSEGRSLEPSAYLNDLRRLVPEIREIQPPTTEDPSDLSGAQIPADLSERVGAYLAARFDRRIAGRRAAEAPATVHERDNRMLGVYNRIVEPPGLPGAMRLLEYAARLWGYDNRARLSERHVALLHYRRDLITSASRIEAFARCPYQHFAGNILRLRPRPEARVSPLEMGSLAHRALEELFRRGIPTQNLTQVRRDMEEVYESIEAEEAFRAFREDALGAFRWRGSRRQLLKYLETEARRLAATPFRPHAFEEAFGTADRPALRIDLGDGTNLVLRGRIDRIDVRDTDDSREALIIDYKSTGRGDRGGLRNLESGLDLQLAVYMLAAESLGYSPVGALYVPVLHKPQREDSGEAPGDTKARGLIPEDRHQAIAGGTKTIVRAGKEGRIDDVARLRDVLEEARGILRIYGLAIKQGRIDIAPVRHGGRVPCDSCDFRGLCRVDPGYNRTRSSALEGFDVADEGPGPADPESRGDSP